ncbi:universal stress protein [Desulfobacula sp.]|uniref:universal stress protein n=1 Tax=Desulfobacula sp. TaxID=2593537 RepID=UPI0026090BC2|nr:universal stress protein [Desulfobacula sp.]
MKPLTNKTKKIVVALDFSTYSKSIFEYAVNMARSIQSEITILHIINQKVIDFAKKQFEADQLEFFPVSEFIAGEKNRRIAKIETLIQDCQAEDITTKIHIEEGIPSVEIINFLENSDAAFCVIGQKGKTDLPEFLFGTVAEKVFRHSPMSILSLRF